MGGVGVRQNTIQSCIRLFEVSENCLEHKEANRVQVGHVTTTLTTVELLACFSRAMGKNCTLHCPCVWGKTENKDWKLLCMNT